MRLSLKIALAILSMAAILSAGMFYSMTAARNIERTYARVADYTLPMVQALEVLRYRALRMVSTAGDRILEARNGTATDPAVIEDAVSNFWAAFDRFSTLVDRDEGRDTAVRDRIRGNGVSLEIIARQVQVALSFGADDRRLAEQQSRLHSLEKALNEDIVWFLEAEREGLQAAKAAVDSALVRQRATVLFCSVGFLAALGVIGVLARRMIVQPIEELTCASERVGSGDFELPPDRPRKDEIGVLNRAFRRMIGEIQELVATANAGKAAVEESEARFRDFAEASSDWLWETDAEGCLYFLSERFTKLTGHDRDAFLGKPLWQLMTTAGHERRRIELGSRRALRNLDCEYTDASGELRNCRLSGRAVFDADGGFVGFRGTATDTTEEMAAVRKAEYLSRHDALTGLPNRVLFAERLSDALAARAGSNSDVAVLFIDLDRFKEINDTMGHDTGDALLVSVARQLSAAVAPGDTVARLGGDEFAIVQVDLPQPAAAESLCREILNALSQPLSVSGSRIVSGGSIGVALASGGSATEASLLRDADIAMYRAKADGRGLYRFHDESMNRELERRRRLELALRDAVEENAFELHYQPFYDSRARAIVGVEALLRWPRPGQPPVSPAEFIPVAEDLGLIVPLGAWVLRTACAAAADWPGLSIAVNLSPLQFLNDGFLDLVSDVLDTTGLEPGRLELEITEGVLLEQTDAAMFQLDALRELGVRLVVDDFGTGYSSLSYLQRFLFDKIKLDRSFINGVGHSDHSEAIVRAVLRLGRALDVETLGEGVETERQIELLAAEGCDQLQGFYFSRPLPRDEMTALLAKSPETGGPVPGTPEER